VAVKILIVLQNAWLKSRTSYDRIRRMAEKFGENPDEAWHRTWRTLLAWSPTGKRLRLLIDEDVHERADVAITESTDEIIFGSSSKAAKPKPEYVRAELEKYRPKLVVCCGVQAELATTPLWHGSLLAVPHPTHRFLTNELYKRARVMINEYLNDGKYGPRMRYRLKQMPPRDGRPSKVELTIVRDAHLFHASELEYDRQSEADASHADGG
jgi:hypothetical protein